MKKKVEINGGGLPAECPGKAKIDTVAAAPPKSALASGRKPEVLPASGARVSIYARYSTAAQKGGSVQKQLDLCGAYAARKGWRSVGVYSDKDGAPEEAATVQRIFEE